MGKEPPSAVTHTTWGLKYVCQPKPLPLWILYCLLLLEKDLGVGPRQKFHVVPNDSRLVLPYRAQDMTGKGVHGTNVRLRAR